MKKCFVTVCTDENYGKNVRIDYLINSLNYFHPDIPLIIFDSEKLKALLDDDGWPASDERHKAYYYKSIIGRGLYNEYEAIAFIDADSTITGDLSDIFEGDYDIAVVRNNTDIGSAGMHKGITIHDPFKHEDIPLMKYINAGLYVIKNKELWDDWTKANKKYGNNFPSIEQDILNCIVNSDKYKVRYLDPVGSGISYGLCNAWGKHTHWDSWRESYLCNDQLFIDNGFGIPLLTKILHVAGGSSTGYPKQDFDRFFTGEVKEWLYKITDRNYKMEHNIQLIRGTEMRPEHDKGMRDIIEKLKPGTVMVEVGCYYGESTLIWASSDKIDKIVAVDRWMDFYDKSDLASERGNMKEVERMFDANIKGNSKIEKIKGSSVDVSKLFTPQKLDFIYIDASHKYDDVVADINAWRRCLKGGSILGGHDINNSDVRRAVYDTIGEPDFTFDDFSWIKTIN